MSVWHEIVHELFGIGNQSEPVEEPIKNLANRESYSRRLMDRLGNLSATTPRTHSQRFVNK